MKSVPTPDAASSAAMPLALLSPQRFNKPIARRSVSHSRSRNHSRNEVEIEGVSFARLPTVQGAFNLQGEPSVKHLVACAEITFGTCPDVLIRRAVDLVQAGPLRDFLKSVTAERDVRLILTALPLDDCMFQRRPIERLRSAARTAALQSMLGPRARDTLYAAVLIAGIESLLGEQVQEPCTPLDVIRAVVRPALKTLREADAQQADDLCNCLGWGNPDELDGSRIPFIQALVRRSVQTMRSRMQSDPGIHQQFGNPIYHLIDHLIDHHSSVSSYSRN